MGHFPSHVSSLKLAAADSRKLELQAAAHLISLHPLTLQPAKDPILPCSAGTQALAKCHWNPPLPTKWWIRKAEDAVTHS